MFSFDLSENIRKPNCSYPLIHTRTCVYLGVRKIRFSDVFRFSGDQKGTLRRKESKGQNLFLLARKNHLIFIFNCYLRIGTSGGKFYTFFRTF